MNVFLTKKIPSESVLIRFHKKYVVDSISGYWNWIGAKQKGYGCMRIKENGVWIMQRMHRFSYEIHRHVITDGLFCCHKCDNKACINPEHLFLGTHTDNMQDQTNKGKHPESKKTHCPKGHVYDEINTYNRTSKKSRECKNVVKNI